MSEYTPTVDEAREEFARTRGSMLSDMALARSRARAEMFDRMIARVKVEAGAAALEAAKVEILAEAKRSAEAQRASDLDQGLSLIGTSTANEVEWYQMGSWAAMVLNRVRSVLEGEHTEPAELQSLNKETES